MNIHNDTTKHGYFLRLCGIHIVYVAGFDNKGLTSILNKRNTFYAENHYLPESLFLRPCKSIEKSEKSRTGIAGIGLIICKKRMDNPYVINTKLKHLKKRYQINRDFVVSKLAYLKSDELKQAVALKTKNAEQYNLIVDEYNRLIFKKLLPIAKREARTLKPELFQHSGCDYATWEKALKNVFPRGLAFNYLAKV